MTGSIESEQAGDIKAFVERETLQKRERARKITGKKRFKIRQASPCMSNKQSSETSPAQMFDFVNTFF